MRTLIRVVLRSSYGVAGKYKPVKNKNDLDETDVLNPKKRKYGFIEDERRDSETAPQAAIRITKEYTGVKIFRHELTKLKTQNSRSGSTGILTRTVTFGVSPPDSRIIEQVITYRPDGTECSIIPFDAPDLRLRLQQKFRSFLEANNLLKPPRKYRRSIGPVL